MLVALLVTLFVLIPLAAPFLGVDSRDLQNGRRLGA